MFILFFPTSSLLKGNEGGSCSFPCIPFCCWKIDVITEKYNKQTIQYLVCLCGGAEHPCKPQKLMGIHHQRQHIVEQQKVLKRQQVKQGHSSPPEEQALLGLKGAFLCTPDY